MPRERAPRDGAATLDLTVQYATTRERPDRASVRRWVRAALAVVEHPARRYALTLRFVDADESRALNHDFRDKDYATNVLTFAYSEGDAGDGAVAADIVVCLPVVENEAAAQGKGTLEHCAHLVVHGTLHAAGYDHEGDADAAAMEALERSALERVAVADPYVERVVAERQDTTAG